MKSRICLFCYLICFSGWCGIKMAKNWKCKFCLRCNKTQKFLLYTKPDITNFILTVHLLKYILLHNQKKPSYRALIYHIDLFMLMFCSITRNQYTSQNNKNKQNVLLLFLMNQTNSFFIDSNILYGFTKKHTHIWWIR